MRLFLIALLALVIPTFAFSADPATDGTAIAGQWLKLVDNQDYAASWREASTEFQKQVSEAQWVAGITQARSPLGAMTSRKVANVTNTKSLPGLPDGEYTVIQFQSSFANKQNAAETVTLIAREGVSKVGGYFIK